MFLYNLVINNLVNLKYILVVTVERKGAVKVLYSTTHYITLYCYLVIDKHCEWKNHCKLVEQCFNIHRSNTPNARKKDDKTEKESSKEKLSDVSDSEAESDQSDDEDSHDKKDASLDDDDTEWEK